MAEAAEGDEPEDYAQVEVNEDAKSPLTKFLPRPPSGDFPAISDCLEVVFAPGKGRHVVAKRDIQGEQLFL